MTKKVQMIFFAFLFFVPALIYAQEQEVTGQVVDESGMPIPGVSVYVQGTTTGTTTDFDGVFNLEVPGENSILVFSYVGFQTREIPLEGRTDLEVTLSSDVEALDEVVVVGYGTLKKSDVTGAVSKVDGERLQNLASPDPLEALQGRASGVRVVSNSGAPAAGQTVRIRGVGSLTNSDPLYVVDGFPTDNINNVAASSIESIEVLKDASATAIYGSRGANGVIIVTTNRGDAGKPEVTFSSYYGVQEAWKQIDLLNAAEYATLRLEAFENEGQALGETTEAKLRFAMENNSVGTDWQDVVFTQGIVQNYDLAVSGGSEEARYNITGTYHGNDGIVKHTYLERLFTRANIDLKFSDRISGGLNMALSTSDYSPVSSGGGILLGALQKDPLTAIRDETGNWGRSGVADIAGNPARAIEHSRSRYNKDNRVQAGAFVRAEIFEQLSFTSQFTTDFTNGERLDYSPQYFVANNERRARSELFTENAFQSSWVNSNYLNYSETFAKHDIDATGGIEFNHFKNKFSQITAFDVPSNPELWYVSASRAPDEVSASDGETQYSIMSYFGRMQYSYDDRYLLTGTIRWDGSSKFVGDYRWGTFPSFSAAWNLHNEPFFPETNIITSAKFRAGWGEVGNQATVAPYSYLTLFRPGYNYTFGGALVPGSIPTRLANPDIRWETSQTANVGVDLAFFNNQLTATADYFVRKTLDMLYPLPSPGFAGALGGATNIGDLENKGFELQMEYRGGNNDFQFYIAPTATHVRTTVTSLGAGEPTEVGSESRSGGPTTRTEEGMTPGYFYGLVTDGIFQSAQEISAYTNAEGLPIQPDAQPGDVKYVDINGDGRISFADDRTDIGNAYPDWELGLSMGVDFKNFDLNVMLTSSLGNEIANMMTFYLEHPEAGFIGSNSIATRLDRWTEENPSSTEPRVTATDPNQNFLYSDRYIEDGSYLRLKNIQVGYTFSDRLINGIGLTNLRIYVSSDNLFTITDYSGFDPEISNFQGDPLQAGVDYGSYPQARTFIAGININL